MKRSDAHIEAPSALFAALGDPTRLRLVVRLSRGEPLSITELASGTKMTRQAVTKHLHVLAGAEVLGIDTSADGRVSAVRTTRGDIETDVCAICCG